MESAWEKEREENVFVLCGEIIIPVTFNWVGRFSNKYIKFWKDGWSHHHRLKKQHTLFRKANHIQKRAAVDVCQRETHFITVDKILAFGRLTEVPIDRKFCM